MKFTDLRIAKTLSFSPDFEPKTKTTLTFRERRRQARNARKTHGITRNLSPIFFLASKYFISAESDGNSDSNRSIRFRRSSFSRYNNFSRHNNPSRYSSTSRPDSNIDNNQAIDSYNKATGDFFKETDSNDITFPISEFSVDSKIFFLPRFTTARKSVVKATETTSDETTATGDTGGIRTINNDKFLFSFACRHRHANPDQIKIKILSPITAGNVKIVVGFYYFLPINTVILILHK